MKVRTPSSKLSSAAFVALVNVLENVDRQLGQLCDHLWNSAAATASHLDLGATIAALLQDELLPKPAQRLVAIYILYDLIVTRHTLTKSHPVSLQTSLPLPNPLTPSSAAENSIIGNAIDRLIDCPLTIILFELVDDGEKRLPEQLFLSHLLTYSQTPTNDTPLPAQITQASAATLWNALEGAMHSGAAVPKLNISSLRSLWTDRHPDPPLISSQPTIPPISTAGAPPTANNPSLAPPQRSLPPISGVVLDADPYSTSEPGQLGDELGTVTTLEDFTPSFVRIPPPLVAIHTDSKELRWIDPEPLHEIVWDPDMGMRGERGSELREIVARALKSPIPEAQQQRVVAQLDAEPKLVHLCGLTPQKLPDLVQNNASLATKVLLKLTSSRQMTQYLAALVDMEMNLNSIEVVNRLSNAVHLPSDFIHTYISKCIQSCRDIPDKYGQVRMVRFVCMFLKNLIKNKTIDVQDFFIEVQSFCIDHSGIREVADLFRSLKSYSAQQ